MSIGCFSGTEQADFKVQKEKWTKRRATEKKKTKVKE